MIRVINADILEVTKGFICHQTNCRGVMGSGVARAIRHKYPKVYYDYLDFCIEHGKPKTSSLLGLAQFVVINSDLVVCNLFAQDDYGMDGKQYTDYNALRNCLEAVKAEADLSDLIAFPYLMGCYRGGGNWDVVYAMIEEIFEGYNIVLYRKDVD